MFPLAEGEKITVVLPVRAFDGEHFVFMATANGTVKKTPLPEFANPRKAGLIAVDLDPGDFLIGAAITDGRHDVMLFRTRASCPVRRERRAADGPPGAGVRACSWTAGSP